jgi:hypothetical protein
MQRSERIAVIRTAITALQDELRKLEAEETAAAHTQDSAAQPNRQRAASARWCEKHQRYEAQHGK